MAPAPAVDDVAIALQTSIGLFIRQLRQAKVGDDEPSLAERSALVRLDRYGPRTAADLARAEQISPQSMGSTLTTLVSHGWVSRRRDPDDGRRIIMSITAAGRRLLSARRNVRAEQIAAGLSAGFTAPELRQLAACAPLIERLALRL